jgi:hypothetical protein
LFRRQYTTGAARVLDRDCENLPLAAQAWGPEGHAIVGEIAEGYLTPKARQEVAAMLGSQKLSDYEVASWPDIIRGTQEYAEKYPHNGRWHFVEFDVTKRYNDEFELALPGDGQDIVSQIRRWRDELATGKLDPEGRLDGLRFLVHFVGDIHQPMHCAYRYGDMGGNMIPVNSFQGQHYSFGPETQMDYAQSIHSVWDEALVNELMAGRSAHAVAQQLRKEITPNQVAWWSTDDPMIWATDSYWRARKDAYRWADGTSLPYKWMRPGMDMTRANYIDAKLPLVREQLQKGGVRLAHALNRALDPGAPGRLRTSRGCLSRSFWERP